MTQHDPQARTAATLVAMLLLLLSGANLVALDGGLRFAVGAACLIGLLVCVRVLARSGGTQSP